MTDRPGRPDPAIRILFVDDDPEFLDLVEIFLGERHADLTVETATTGGGAVERLAAGGIDCIVSDYRMPEMDGLDLLGSVREDHPDLPFILFTAKGGEDIAADAVSAGVTDYIRKSTDPDQFGLLANRVRNVVERQRARVQYQAVFDSVSEAILVIDAPSETVTDANRRAAELWGYHPDALVGRAVADLRADPGTEPSPDARSFDAADTPVETGSEWHCVTRDGRRFWAAISQRAADIDGRTQTLVIVRDVTRRKTRQRQLDRLLQTVRDLLVEASEAAIADAVETTAVDVLRFADATVHLLDDDGRRFRVIADGGTAREATPGMTEWLWEALDAGELVVAPGDGDRTPPDSSGSGEAAPADERPAGQAQGPVVGTLYLPLGDVGVLRCEASPQSDGHDLDLLELLATFAAGAFDRARREALLRDREETVRQHRDELLALNHVNEVIRDINQALVSVSSREGIERLVCEKFVATDRYRFAWVGDHDASDHAVVPTAQAGPGEGYLPERLDLDSADSSAMGRAVADRVVTVVDRITPEVVGEERYRLARERGFRSVAFVPVAHQNVLYRLVAIYADEPRAFGQRERAVLGELGETIGLAMAAAEWRSARISETTVDLELAVGGSGGLFALASDDAQLQLTEFEETGAGALQVFGRLSGATFEAFEQVVAADPSLAEPRQLAADADGVRVVFSIQSGPLLNAITSAGIALEEGSIVGGSGSLSLTVPTGTDVRWVVEQFQAAFDTVELVGRRDRYRGESSTGGESPLAALTERQLESLRIAYHAGYFDRPRQATGEAVAEILGITQPTFNEHLRNAEYRLFGHLLQSTRPSA